MTMEILPYRTKFCVEKLPYSMFTKKNVSFSEKTTFVGEDDKMVYHAIISNYVGKLILII